MSYMVAHAIWINRLAHGMLQNVVAVKTTTTTTTTTSHQIEKLKTLTF
jgi:hypothetical protein